MNVVQTSDDSRATLQFPEQRDMSELPIFDFSSILLATDYFSIKNKLGQGGFGPVFKVGIFFYSRKTNVVQKL